MCHDCCTTMQRVPVLCVCVHVHVCVYVCVCVLCVVYMCMCACVCCVLLALTGPPVQCTDVLLVIASVNKNLFNS